MKKILKIVIPVIIVLMILVVVVVLFKPEKKDTKLDKKKAVEDVLNNVYYEDEITMDELENTMDAKMMAENIFMGPDSILRKKPSADIISKYHLEEYEKIQKKYYPIVEKKYKDNTKYSTQEVDDQIEVTVTPWYFSQYSYDLSLIASKLMSRAGYEVNIDDLSSTKYKVNEYKGRILAMRILDSHLDDYNNTTNETQKVQIGFKSDKAGEYDYYTLYLVLAGAASTHSPGSNPNYREENDARLESYISEAINDHLINAKNPLKA